MVIIRAIAMIASVPFVAGFLGNAKERAYLSDLTLFRLDQTVPAQSEHRHPAPPIELPLGVNCTKD